MKSAARILLLLSLFTLEACQASQTHEISESDAIEIARQHVTFEPTIIKAEKDTEDGRPVWRVTFRGKPGPIPMGNFMIVTIDRQSGELVGVAMS